MESLNLRYSNSVERRSRRLGVIAFKKHGGNMQNKIPLRVAALALFAGMHITMATSRAADVTIFDVSSGPGDAAVDLVNWGWEQNPRLSAFAEEGWNSSGDFALDVSMMAESLDRGALLTVPTDFRKTVTNLTSFEWTNFETLLIPSPGAVISNVMASPNAELGNVAVVDNLDGSFSLLWDNAGGNGSGVSINDMVSFNFSFDVTGPSSELVNYKIRQIPTPEPASAMLLLLSTTAVVARKRRRQ